MKTWIYLELVKIDSNWKIYDICDYNEKNKNKCYRATVTKYKCH
jgi:hypothetical protein